MHRRRERDVVELANYRFGSISIDGRHYSADVIVTPERVVAMWRRNESHKLAVADLKEVIAAKPDIVVVGTGYFGRMVVAEETRRYLQAQGIQLREAHTGEAVEEFNRLQRDSARVVGALHLTC